MRSWMAQKNIIKRSLLGIALAYLLAACAMAAVLSLVAFSYFYPLLRTNKIVTRNSASSSLLTQAAYALAAESADSDADGAYEPPAFQTGAGGPADGGTIPASSHAPKTDAYGINFGYCAWDNGTTNSSANRITGDNPATPSSVTLAVVAAGPDHLFQSTCANIKNGIISGDDEVRILTHSQVRQAVQGTVYHGDPVANATALAAYNNSNTPDGQIRLQNDTGVLKRWDATAGNWVSISGQPSNRRNHNYLLNGIFDVYTRDGCTISFPGCNHVWQGADNTYCTLPACALYFADRWRLRWSTSGSGATVKITQTMGLGDAYNTPAARFYLDIAPSALTGTLNYILLEQPIEKVRTLAGKTVTVSFWAKAGAAMPLSIMTDQNFGTGGSPKVTTTAGTVNLTTTWQKYALTYVIPNITGKTIGSNNDDYVSLYFYWTAMQTLDLALVQLEEGQQATAFDFLPKQEDQLLCLRYFESSWVPYNNTSDWTTFEAFMPANGTFYRFQLFRVPKRVTPIVTSTAQTANLYNVTGPTVTGITPRGFNEKWTYTSSTAGMGVVDSYWSADADYTNY